MLYGSDAVRQEAAGAADASPEAQRAMISPRFTHLPMLTVYGNRFVREALVGARPELFDGSVPAQMRFQEIREGERVEFDLENAGCYAVTVRGGERLSVSWSVCPEDR